MEAVVLSPAEVRPLRRAVLRPHQEEHELVYHGDDDPLAFHAGVRDGSRIVAVGTVAPEPHPRAPEPGDWRLRGMATVPAARGTGAGRAVLEACVAAASERGGRRIWCNARLPSAGFYERLGFAVESEVFELPGIGPHVLMARRL